MFRALHCVLGLLVLGGALAPPAGAQVRGVVFDDANASGTRDPGERGLAGVAVSNQAEVVLSDTDGGFELAPASGIIFVSVPDGRRVVGRSWQRTGSGAAPLLFALAPVPRPAEFTFIHASDTHLAERSLSRMRRLRALADSLRPAFVLITGDLVRDALRVPEPEAAGYYDLFVRESGAFPVPVHPVPGNHELFGIERHHSLVAETNPMYGRGMYRHYLGPDYYSFTHGGVHFVGLNTADHDDLWYYGHVDSLQMRWLERDLAVLPPGMPVVTFNHIPFASAVHDLDGFQEAGPAPTLIRIRGTSRYRHVVSNADSVIRAVGHRRLAIALGGHMHRRESLSLPVDGGLIRFHQAAAVVAPAAAAGITTPSGITLYRVRNGVVDDGTFVPLS